MVYLLTKDYLLHTGSHQALLAVRTVVGHDYHLVAACTHFVFKDDEVLGASSQHAHHAVACLLEGANDRQ